MGIVAGRFVYWTPRVLGMAFAAFLGVFALDVFSTPGGAGPKALALLIHLVPSGLVLLALLAAWRHEWLGAILFPLLVVVHLAAKWGHIHWLTYLLLDLPPLLLGLLFWINWRIRVAQPPAAGGSA